MNNNQWSRLWGGLWILGVISLASGCSTDAAPPTLGPGRAPVDQPSTSDTVDAPKPHSTGDSVGSLLARHPNEDFTPSFAQLLTNPDRYHGKEIRLEGFLHVEFEGNAIYLSKDHADHSITKEGFWVSFDKKALEYDGIVGPKEFHRCWVLLEGTFNKNGKGHMSGWSGEIQNIDRVMLLTNFYGD